MVFQKLANEGPNCNERSCSLCWRLIAHTHIPPMLADDVFLKWCLDDLCLSVRNISLALNCILTFTSAWKHRPRRARGHVLPAHFGLFQAALITVGSQAVTTAGPSSKPVRAQGCALQDVDVSVYWLKRKRKCSLHNHCRDDSGVPVFRTEEKRAGDSCYLVGVSVGRSPFRGVLSSLLARPLNAAV